jgi:pyridoxine 4-dehydrogenase
VDSGCTYWNAGEFYGTPTSNSLTLLRKFFDAYPDATSRVLVNVKGGIRFTEHGFTPDGSPEYIAQSIANCAEMLGPVGKIDEFELARRDAGVPYTESVAAINEFVGKGVVGGVACSETSAATLRAAAKVVKVSSVEVELSLWHTEPLTNGIAEAAAELGIPLVAYGLFVSSKHRVAATPVCFLLVFLPSHYQNSPFPIKTSNMAKRSLT